MDLGFGKNGRAEIGAEAEELKPEALGSHGENALLAEARRQASRLLAAPADEGERHKTQSQHRPG